MSYVELTFKTSGKIAILCISKFIADYMIIDTDSLDIVESDHIENYSRNPAVINGWVNAIIKRFGELGFVLEQQRMDY